MIRPVIVLTFEVDEVGRAAIKGELGDGTELVSLSGLDQQSRRMALQRAKILLSRNTGAELLPGETGLIHHIQLIQFLTAGIDFIPLHDLPPEVPLASNGGAYAEPMAEHALAMTLAAAKRLLVEHAALAQGAFNQFTSNRMLAGGVCGILGFGGIGIATARLMRGLGMHIHAIRRSGVSEEPVDWIGRPDRLDDLLAAADVLILSLPLTRGTRGLIGRRELGLMKSDAILVNLARGEIIDEQALYDHLRATPDFTACLDAWWVEPVRHGHFRMDQPFMQLPNVIGSPHNSASVCGWREVALRRAAANCRRVLDGLLPLNLIGADERVAASS